MKISISSGCAVVSRQKQNNHFVGGSLVPQGDFLRGVGGASAPKLFSLRSSGLKSLPQSGLTPLPQLRLKPLPQWGHRRHALALVMTLMIAACSTTIPASTPEVSSATTFAQAGLVGIHSLVPDIAEDIRYASADNFVGVPVDGYDAPRCYLRESSAQALQRVEMALREDGFRLRLFDCYRPARAVRHFVRWAGDLQDQRTKARHYPNLDKQALLGDYIAPVSGHSRGATVDLTLLDCRAGADNFVGVPVDGYRAPRCYLRESSAEALRDVEAALRKEGFRLQLFDCYRPARAVAHFVRWAGDLQDQRTRAHHYPNLDKQALLGEYIAPVSGHSRGATVDLTLLDCRAGDGRCQALDMGTDFDFFDPRANTDSAAITAQQRKNRQRLLGAMARQGFRNYPQEWWHYSLASETSKAIYDIPVE